MGFCFANRRKRGASSTSVVPHTLKNITVTMCSDLKANAPVEQEISVSQLPWKPHIVPLKTLLPLLIAVAPLEQYTKE
jgi:hypothetical protein